MNREQQLERFNNMVDVMEATILSKWDDYAGVDRLSNFKKVGAMCWLSPEIVTLVMVATKVARLWTLLNSPESPRNESIQDSIIDLANYSCLLSMVVSETRP